MRTAIRIAHVLLAVLLGMGNASVALAQEHEEHGGEHGEESESRFSDEPIPLADIPERPRPLIELGPKFLGPGNINQGFKIPTGAVWTPAFIIFGTLRTATQGLALQGGDGAGDTQLAEAVARLDLFGNLYLTPTERILIGIRPLDENGSYTRYNIYSDGLPSDTLDDFQDALNIRLQTLFFEGDIAEIFPALDRDDSNSLDYYISVGRQPLSFQDGLLLNEDALDMVGLTKSNLKLGSLVNTRVAGVFGWGHIDRANGLVGLSSIGDCDEVPGAAFGGAGFSNCNDGSALLFGLFTETDTPVWTVELDGTFVSADDSTGSGVYGGLGAIRRIGQFNNTLRIVGSYPVGEETPFIRPGVLIHNQFGFTPHHTHNWAYIGLFGGIGRFRSAARAPTVGGPLAQTGLLFTSPEIGRLGEVLWSYADEAVGGSIGYQMFFGHDRRQHLILEAGGRYTYGDSVVEQNQVGGAARYSFAVGRRGTVILDGFGSYDLNASRPLFGTRLELAIRF